MNLETTLTLMVAGGLLVVGALLFGLVWGVLRIVRWTGEPKTPKAKTTRSERRRARDEREDTEPRDPLLPRIARPAGFVAGRARKLSARYGWAAWARLRTAGRYASALVLFLAAEGYALVRKDAGGGSESPAGRGNAESPYLPGSIDAEGRGRS